MGVLGRARAMNDCSASMRIWLKVTVVGMIHSYKDQRGEDAEAFDVHENLGASCNRQTG